MPKHGVHLGPPLASLAVVSAAVLLGFTGSAAAGPIDPVSAPLPSSALMGILLFGGLAAFARFPSHRRRRRRY